MTDLSKGLIAAALSNILFVVLFLYGIWMKPMTGTEVFAWRMVAMLAALFVLMGMVGGWQAADRIYTRRRPGLETLAADFPAHPCFCEPVVAVCLVACQRRGRECGDGLFSVSAGYDVVRADLV